MKTAGLLLLSVFFSAVLSGPVCADDTSGEWTVTIGCAKCNFAKETGASSCAAAGKTAAGKVVLLKGAAMKDVKYKDGGSYTVKGTLAADGKSIEVTEITKKD